MCQCEHIHVMGASEKMAFLTKDPSNDSSSSYFNYTSLSDARRCLVVFSLSTFSNLGVPLLSVGPADLLSAVSRSP